MVTPLQLDGKINRPAASKTQARDLETPPFADILSALSKPAQKEKEVSPETIAAAIAAMQTRPVQFVEILPEPASVTEAVTIAPSNARSQANRPVAVSPLPEAGVAPEAAPAQNVEVESNPTNPIQVGVESGKKKEKKASSTAKTESSPKLVVEMQKPPAQAASVPVETPAMPQVTGKPIETVIAKAETPDPAPRQAASVPAETPGMPQATGKPIETVTAKAKTPDPAPRQAAITESRPKMIAQAASVPAETPEMPQATGKPIETVTVKAETPDPAPRQAASVPVETPARPQVTGKPIETVIAKAETPDPAPRQAATTESSPKMTAQAASALVETPEMPQVTGKPIETVTAKAETPDPAPRQAAITESSPKMVEQPAQTMFFGVESGSKDEKLGSASAQTVSDDAVAAQNDMGLQQIRVADDAKVEKTGVEKDFSMPDGAGIQQKVANAAVTGRTDGADSVLPVMQKNEPAKGEPVVQDEKSSRAFFKKDERKVGDVEKSSESGKLAAFGSPLHTQAMGKPDANFAASHSPVVDVAEQVARQLSTRLQPGMGAMRLELHPQELGAIDVQVARGPQGVSVTFFAEQPATGRLLEAQMGQLRQSLSDAGVQLAGLNVGQQRQEGGGFQQNPFARAQQVSAPVAATSAEEPDALAWQAGRIDYRV